MHILPLNSNKDNTKFYGIHYKNRFLTEEQKQLTKQIEGKLNQGLSQYNSQKLINYYNNLGFDFIVMPESSASIIVYTTNKFSLIKWILKNNYFNKNMFKVGVYDKHNIKNFRRHLNSSHKDTII